MNFLAQMVWSLSCLHYKLWNHLPKPYPFRFTLVLISPFADLVAIYLTNRVSYRSWRTQNLTNQIMELYDELKQFNFFIFKVSHLRFQLRWAKNIRDFPLINLIEDTKMYIDPVSYDSVSILPIRLRQTDGQTNDAIP